MTLRERMKGTAAGLAAVFATACSSIAARSVSLDAAGVADAGAVVVDGGGNSTDEAAPTGGEEVTDATGLADAAVEDGSGADGYVPGGGTHEGDSGVCSVSAAGELVASVAGTWTFTPASGSATTVEVPGGGWVAQGFKVSEATYQRLLTIPDLGRPQATYLELGAVNHQATLTVDGTTVGSNTTSFTPSVFDVTNAVKPGMGHQFAIDVKGRDALKNGKLKVVPDAAGWSPNVPQGIFRSAVLRVVPALHVLEAFARTDVAGDKFSIDVWVKNGGSSAANGTVSAGLSSWTCDSFQYPTVPPVPVTVPAGMTTKVTLGPVTWGLGPSSYWWPNVPYTKGYRAKLHVAAVTITPDAGGGGNAAAHTVPVRFGFRQIQQAGAYYELNGVRVNFRGDDIQGADYDSITNVGVKGPGDAYDLFPGFLPPSAKSAGWPGAVDNWQRLNYNVARIHQEPATPYMLDVLDEMGFMAIDETAIRGSNNDQDFTTGLANMLAHLNALVDRDRNHPAVIRWSQINEPEFDSTNSTQFEQQLYQTAMAADDTRPISADSAHAGAGIYTPYGVTAPNFAVLEHYPPPGTGKYADSVTPVGTRPFGVGEYVWPADNSKQGLAWFATATMSMRQKDASDLRPYTLLSGWASFVPGVTTTIMSIEQGGPPLFGEDNFPDPWSSPIIVRIQRAFNPVAVVDVAYWNANRQSNAQGTWPAAIEQASRGTQMSRQLVVFNDTFSGTGVDVSWEMHQDTATGTTVDQGTEHLDIPLGQRNTAAIMVTAPSSGTNAVLVLQSSKDGTVIFRDDAEIFQLQ